MVRDRLELRGNNQWRARVHNHASLVHRQLHQACSRLVYLHNRVELISNVYGIVIPHNGIIISKINYRHVTKVFSFSIFVLTHTCVVDLNNASVCNLLN